MAALDKEHATKISELESQREVDLLARITHDTYWKLKIFSSVPYRPPWLLDLLDQCTSEDLANVLIRCPCQCLGYGASSPPRRRLAKPVPTVRATRPPAAPGPADFLAAVQHSSVRGAASA